MNSEFPVADLRASFPALVKSLDFVFFDNAAGAQIPRGGTSFLAHYNTVEEIHRFGDALRTISAQH